MFEMNEYYIHMSMYYIKSNENNKAWVSEKIGIN